jgi:Putative Ig domain
LTLVGTLPSGVTFVDNGNGTATLSGTPAAGTAKTYALKITAKSTAGSVTQSFSLVVRH